MLSWLNLCGSRFCRCLSQTRAPEPGHHLVSHYRCSVAARQLTRASQPTSRLSNHSGGSLHKGLHQETGVRSANRSVRFKFSFEQAKTFPVALAIVARVGAFRLGPVESTTIAVRRHHFV